jgi:raffinose/stachyose/melibiose transport system permease protein
VSQPIVTDVAVAAVPRLSRRRRRRGRDLAAAAPFLLPAVLLYGTFIVYPMLDAVRLSFFDWDGFATTAKTWVGLDNYRRIFLHDPVFWTAFRNSVKWLILSLIIPTVLGLGLALLLNRRLRGRNLFRTIYYLPAVLAPIAVAAMWRWMYDPNFGVFNRVLDLLGIDAVGRAWLGDPDTALYATFVASVWTVAGLNMVLFLAGLQNIPRELTEAARIDGASTTQVFRHVTLPGLRPAIVIVIVLTIINSLKAFDLIVGTTGGGPAQQTQVLALWSYTQSFANHDFGAGNAVATVLLLLTLVVVVPYLGWSMRQGRAS